MTDLIEITLIVEDLLSQEIVKKIVIESRNDFVINSEHISKGYGKIKDRINSYNEAARNKPFIVLTDLDRTECAPIKKTEWLKHDQHSNLIFRIAERSVESWILADRAGFADYFGVSRTRIPYTTDDIDYPKEKLLTLIEHSRKRRFKTMLPAAGSRIKVGKDYDLFLINFIYKKWDMQSAIKHSPSLKRAVNRIKHHG